VAEMGIVNREAIEQATKEVQAASTAGRPPAIEHEHLLQMTRVRRRLTWVFGSPTGA
jgi:hypothetical protein